jgi:Tfp pilus assembly protein PilF
MMRAMRRCLVAAIVFVLLSSATGSTHQNRSATAAAARFIVSILDAFDRGEYEAFDTRLRDALRQDPSSLNAFAAFIEKDSDGWISSGPPVARERRRVIVAAVAMEAANLGGLRDWSSARALLEWASTLLQKNQQRLAAERIWRRAAIGLIEGASDTASLKSQVARALERFPEDHQFVLARGVMSELHTWPDLRDGRTPRQRDSVASDTAVTDLTEATSFEDTRAEAEVRLGYLSLRNGTPEEALRQLRDAVSATRDRFFQHLAHLFEGRALEVLNRPDEALAAYRAAIAATPGQTAELALAAALFRQGHTADAATIAEASAQASFDRVDPWDFYGKGEARHWAAIADELRRDLQ